MLTKSDAEVAVTASGCLSLREQRMASARSTQRVATLSLANDDSKRSLTGGRDGVHSGAIVLRPAVLFVLISMNYLIAIVFGKHNNYKFVPNVCVGMSDIEKEIVRWLT